MLVPGVTSLVVEWRLVSGVTAFVSLELAGGFEMLQSFGRDFACQMVAAFVL